MEQTKKLKSASYKKYFALLISPAAVAAAVLAVFSRIGLYPFGERTAAWCDMNQQVVPLLCQFKDILDGKSGMFLSFKNASGMNFWGVFFFFLASPFSFLVKFVDKTDMLVFANILILLKMMTCSVTASLYFIKSPEHRKLGIAEISLLGFIYSLSGYVMLFYQNVIWLDMMYLFPLLLMSLQKIRRGDSPLMYTAVMAAMMIVDYYIGYMTVIFTLILAAMYVLFSVKSEKERTGAACRRFLIGSLIAALISAVVWLPSFLQYLTSGRRSSLLENMRTGDFVTDYDTVLPVIMCSSLLILFVLGDLIFVKRRSREHKFWLYMLGIMCVPLFIEPVNKLWHTGSYMSFPARYAFMTVFMGLIVCAYMLQRDCRYIGSIRLYAVGGIIMAAAALLYERTVSDYISANVDSLSDYTKSLGGSEASFKGACRLLIAGMLCLGIMYLIYRKGWVFKGIFIAFVCAVTFVESCGYVRIYMTTAGERNEATNSLQREVLNLSEQIDDDSFYRVKTSAKIFDYNMIGAMGYNSIGHYTSLTDEDYMFTMKRMGYTSVWMEVGTCGGTELTDALLSVGYEIGHDSGEDTVYSYKGYSINAQEYKLPLGVISDADFSDGEIPDGLTRAQVQQYIFNRIFGDGTLISEYDPAEGSYDYDKTSGGYEISGGEKLIYRVKISGNQTLYFDCFDKLTNDLSEPIYDSFEVKVNGKTVSSSYPTSKENGVLNLGGYSDETVIIEVDALKDVECASYGVFGLDTDVLASAIENAGAANLNEKKNGLEGSVTAAESGETMFLAVPYSKGFDIRVNGESVEYREALSGFIAFDLPEGECDIDITFKPEGFSAGLVMSICGIIGAAVYAVLRRIKFMRDSKVVANVEKISAWAVLIMGALAIAAVYVIPTAVNLLMWKE